MRCDPTNTPEDIDLDALRERYRQERDKRIRVEGSTQYRATEGDLASFFEADPHTARRTTSSSSGAASPA